MINVFVFLYHFAWTLAVFFFLPLIPFIRSQRFLERLCLYLPPEHPEKGSIWIHALSVGEVISAIPLVRLLRQQYPRKGIVITVTTTQGMKIARKELEGEVRVLLTMPLDFWWSTRRIVNYIKPSFFIVIETDLWPGLIIRLKKRGIKSVLINGRISPRTLRSYRRFPYLTRIMLTGLELCLMQSDLDTKRLLRIGLGPDKAKTVGNIKFDFNRSPMGQEEYIDWLNTLKLEPEDRLWVAGSTHQGEEEIILNTFERLRSLFTQLRLIIAPRRLERTEEIYKLAVDKGLKTTLRTELASHKETYDVLILNTMGELGRIYGIGKISFVGGSLVPIGGHNLLEPASFGHPVLFGPYTHNFVFMSQLLIEAGGGKRVKDGEDLFKAMKHLLSEPEECRRMGKKARQFVEMNKGALTRVMDHIESYIDGARDSV